MAGAGPTKCCIDYAALLKTLCLEAGIRKLRRDRHTALKLYAEIQAHGLGGPYCRVSELVRALKGEVGVVAACSVYVRSALMHFAGFVQKRLQVEGLQRERHTAWVRELVEIS